jgi:hypothetical protein
MAGLLGLLPERAQHLLQEPFLNTDGELLQNCHATLTEAETSASGDTIQIWCYLTDRQTVTFCAGAGRDYREGVGAASWELNCWRADTPKRDTDAR